MQETESKKKKVKKKVQKGVRAQDDHVTINGKKSSTTDYKHIYDVLKVQMAVAYLLVAVGESVV